jgi:hypothetical protein
MRYPASIDNFKLEIETVSIDAGRSLVEHSFYGVDGARLTDTGGTPRTIKFKAYFINEDYESWSAFADYVYADRSVTLVHPEAGVVYGRVKTISIRHDDRIQTAEVDIEFAEDLFELPGSGLVPALDIIESVNATAISGIASVIAGAGTTFVDRFGANGLIMSGRNLVDGIPFVNQFPDITRTAKNFVGKIETAMSGIDALLADVSVPINSIVSAVDYGTNLPGRFMGSVARCIGRISGAVKTIAGAPSAFMRSFEDGIKELINAAKIDGNNVFDGHIYGIASGVAAVQTAKELVADEQVMIQVAQAASVSAVSLDGKIQARPVIQPASIVSTAVATMRDVKEPRTMLMMITDKANNLKPRALRESRVLVPTVTPLYCVMLQYGAPMWTDEMVVKANNIRNPNAVSGDLVLYV